MPSYSVPFSSQYTDLGHHEWRARGCGITALKMVMDYWSRTTTSGSRDASHATGRGRSFGDRIKTAPSLDELLKTGLAINAYLSGIGWSHKGLVEVARHYGYEGFNVDVAANSPTPKKPAEAWAMVLAELEHGPMLVSVFAGLDSHRAGGHIVVLAGAHDELVFFNDPEEMSVREGCKVLALKAFLSAFKQRYIVIRPR